MNENLEISIQISAVDNKFPSNWHQIQVPYDELCFNGLMPVVTKKTWLLKSNENNCCSVQTSYQTIAFSYKIKQTSEKQHCYFYTKSFNNHTNNIYWLFMDVIIEFDINFNPSLKMFLMCLYVFVV